MILIVLFSIMGGIGAATFDSLLFPIIVGLIAGLGNTIILDFIKYIWYNHIEKEPE
jgi:hypothetical protein